MSHIVTNDGKTTSQTDDAAVLAMSLIRDGGPKITTVAPTAFDGRKYTHYFDGISSTSKNVVIRCLLENKMVKNIQAGTSEIVALLYLTVVFQQYFAFNCCAVQTCDTI